MVAIATNLITTVWNNCNEKKRKDIQDTSGKGSNFNLEFFHNTFTILEIAEYPFWILLKQTQIIIIIINTPLNCQEIQVSGSSAVRYCQ